MISLLFVKFFSGKFTLIPSEFSLCCFFTRLMCAGLLTVTSLLLDNGSYGKVKRRKSMLTCRMISHPLLCLEYFKQRLNKPNSSIEGLFEGLFFECDSFKKEKTDRFYHSDSFQHYYCQGERDRRHPAFSDGKDQICAQFAIENQHSLRSKQMTTDILFAIGY